jgi:hypothetical protein
VAKFHPARLSRHPRPTYGEQKVFERLHDLDDGWLVLSSLSFLWDDKGGRVRPGEADFLLLHPLHGALIVEVKDATYAVRSRQWYRIKGRQELIDKSPFVQAASNRWKITSHLNKRGVKFVPMGHCVLFTHGRPSGDLGPDAPDGIVLTLAKFEPVRDAVMGVVAHWQAGTWAKREDFDRTVKILSPDVLVAPTLEYDIDVSIGEIHRLTDAQVALSTRQLEAVRITSDSPRSLILGGAGTGKTFVAFQYARMLAGRGKRVAVVGAQSELRVLTRKKLAAQGVHSGDLFDILTTLYPDALLEADVGQATWEVLVSLVDDHGSCLDALIVDEAQSLDPDVLAALTELVVDDGQVVLCADPYQLDPTGKWQPEGSYSHFWLTENCRNTLPIGRVVSRVSGSPSPVSGAAGRRPTLLHARDELVDQAVACVQQDLASLSPSEMVVLARSSSGAKRLFEALQRAGVKASRRLRDGYVGVCTVDEFRGCEAKSVIYMAETVGDPDTRTTDYVAISRACAHLRVVSDPDAWSELAFLFEHEEDS